MVQSELEHNISKLVVNPRRQARVIPDIVTFNTALQTFATSDRPKQAVRWLDKMLDAGVLRQRTV